jgi:isopropylmalate/homocitrate/citramalate synthase
MAERVTICEMSPRDGMQVLNRSGRIPLEMRVALLHALQRANFPYIESGSFVSERVLPHMSDTAELLARAKLPEYQGQLAALVPNLKYYEKHCDTPNLTTVALFLSASESYSLKNKRVGIEDDLNDAKQVAALARSRGHRVRAHLSAAFRDLTRDNRDSDEKRVASICAQLVDAGCELVALADTDGRASSVDLQRVARAAKASVSLDRIGVHLHDRAGDAIDKSRLAYDLGIRAFDGAVGGVGGAIAIDHSPGNVATEDLVALFASLGAETGIDLPALRDALMIVFRMTQLVGDDRPKTHLMNEILACNPS